MIEGFQKYLVDNGFKRFTYEFNGKSQISVENNTSYYVSSYGPLYYYFEYEGELMLYWGLNIWPKPPYYFLPRRDDAEVIISNDYKLEMERLLTGNSVLKSVLHD